MSLRDLEAAMLSELRAITGNRKLRQKDIQEWSTSPVQTQGEDERSVFLPLNRVYVAYLEPKGKVTKSTTTPEVESDA